MCSSYRNPLTEYSVTYHYDLCDGSVNEPLGGETRE
jgi:hypothetical protein